MSNIKNEIADYMKGRSPVKSQDTEEYTKYKVLLLGDATVGKTCIMKSLMEREFRCQVPSTVGIDFVKKRFQVDDAKVLLEIWDTAGQERFRSITKFHYRGAKGIVLVYDITNQETVDTLNYWIESIDKDLDQDNKEPVPIYIVGNKCDLREQRAVPIAQGEHVAFSNFVHGFLETSAKDNINIHEVFSQLAYAMTEIYDPSMLKGYEHLAEKKKEEAAIGFTKFAISDVPENNKNVKKRKKRKDYTRNANSITLSSDDQRNSKHSCICHRN